MKTNGESKMRRTKEETEVTRNTLLDAALTVFSRQGYADTRLEDIAQAAGVTRGAIYHHFGGKVELYNALVAERFARANRVWEEAIQQGGTPLQRLRRMMVRSLQYLEEDPEYRAVQELVTFKTGHVAELADGLRKKQEGTRRLLEYLTNLIEQGRAAGEIRPEVSSHDAALAVLGLLNGVSLVWLIDPNLFSLRAQAERIVDSYLKGVSAAR
jgi:TetR/AcrR family acrAB operon transcriptional repressor